MENHLAIVAQKPGKKIWGLPCNLATLICIEVVRKIIGTSEESPVYPLTGELIKLFNTHCDRLNASQVSKKEAAAWLSVVCGIIENHRMIVTTPIWGDLTNLAKGRFAPQIWSGSEEQRLYLRSAARAILHFITKFSGKPFHPRDW